ncbi:MAG TPA: HAMP domain-containing protein, partial [Aquella sp.]|nr:HAMP domain-containing protein [Aquella sp.]
MKLSNKILLSIFLVSVIAITTITIVYYVLVKQHLEDSFNTRYNSLGTSISNSFIEMDKLSDSINYNAVTALTLIEQYRGLPSDKQLEALAKVFGIGGFFAINKLGRFIRSSDIPLSLQKSSLFSYCPAYRDLIYGSSKYQVTPIIPSYPNNKPVKLIMMRNYNSSLILEGSYYLEYIEEILLKTIKTNKNIISIGLYSPNNYELGYIESNGKFEQGKTSANASTVTNGEKIFKYKILANTKDCCECTIKKTQYIDGAYYYDLVIKVSTQSLLKELYHIKLKIIFILLLMFLIAFIVSQIIARKIAQRLGDINESIETIINTGDLSNSLVVMKSVKVNKDEIDSLARSFNHMIEQLNLYQQKVRNTAVAEISSKIVHNIRSPLIVLDTTVRKLSQIMDNSSLNLLKNAIKDIKSLSEM